MIKVISFLLILISPACYAMLCPDNFNQIEYGDSIQKIVKLCGPPDSQYESNYSQSSSQYQTDSYLFSDINSTTNTVGKNINENIVMTIFEYKFPQKAVLIFKNGVLIERKLPIPGSN